MLSFLIQNRLLFMHKQLKTRQLFDIFLAINALFIDTKSTFIHTKIKCAFFCKNLKKAA